MCNVDQKLIDCGQNSADIEGQDENSMTATSNDQPLPSSLKMTFDCFEKIFEWLSLKELLMLRQTCKHFKSLADDYIRIFYPTVKLGRGTVVVRHNIHQFYLYGFDPHIAKFIKELNFWTQIPNAEKVNDFKNILNQIEILNVQAHQVNGEFYDSFLQFCPNVQQLTLWDIEGTTMIGCDNKWMLRSYPQLKHVEFDDSVHGGAGNAGEIPEIETFFEINSNIRTFSTNFHFLRVNGHFFIGSAIKFDVLQIKGDCFYEHGMLDTCALINELHEQGLYQRLHIRANYIASRNDWNEIMTLPAVESMFLENVQTRIVLSPKMSCPKTLGLSSCRFYRDSRRFPSNLLTIECLCIEQISISDLIPFIRDSARLKEIHIRDVCYSKNPDSKTYFKNGLIDIAAMNIQREQLVGACKLTIYVNEKIVLNTKWAGKPTKSALVEVKRHQSHQWPKEFP